MQQSTLHLSDREPLAEQLPTLNLVDLQRLAVEEALRRTETLDEAAKLLGLSRQAVGRRVKKWRLNRPPSHGLEPRKVSTDA